MSFKAPHVTRKRPPAYLSLFLLLLAFFSAAGEARANPVSLLKALLKPAIINADLLRHADLFGKISSETSTAAYFIAKNGDDLEIQQWRHGQLAKNTSISPGRLADLFRGEDDLKVFIPEADLYQYQSEILKTCQGSKITAHIVLESGNTYPLIVRNAETGPALAIKKSESLSYSLNGWSKRSMLRKMIMPELTARMHVIALVSEADAIQREAFKKRLGQRVSFVDSELSLSNELAALDRQLAVLVGHVEGADFLLKDHNGRQLIRTPIADVHQLIDESQSMGLMLGCEVGCKTAFTGPEVDIDALNVVSGIRSGVSQSRPEEFLEVLGAHIGRLHVDEDISGRLQAVSYESIKKERALVAGSIAAGVAAAGSGKVMSRRVLFPREFPLIFSFALLSSVYIVFFVLGWPPILVLYLLVGDSLGVINSVWYVYFLTATDSIPLEPERLHQKLLIVLFAPHLVFTSLFIALWVFPFLIVMRIISRARSTPYPSDLSYKLRWLPFYVVHLIVQLPRTLLQKAGALHAEITRPDAAV